MRRGEVRWYKFSPPDKKRPVLLLTRDAILEYLGDVTVAPITSTIRDIPSEVRLDKEDGMPQDCAVNCDHIQTVSKSRLGALVTTLSAAKMREVSERHRLRVGAGAMSEGARGQGSEVRDQVSALDRCGSPWLTPRFCPALIPRPLPRSLAAGLTRIC